jgi:hypothetical protein
MPNLFPWLIEAQRVVDFVGLNTAPFNAPATLREHPSIPVINNKSIVLPAAPSFRAALAFKKEYTVAR